MARKGRELEILIKKLEKIVLPSGATIISPGFINESITNQPLEVDILIEQNIGATHIKIVIECRDHDATQDASWIEQMHAKLKDLDVHRKIAVSSSMLSQPAKEKAKFYGIETKTLSEINLKTIATWWSLEYIETFSQYSTLLGTAIGLEYPAQFQKAIQGKSLNEKIFFRTTDEKVYSISEMVPSDTLDWSECIVNGPAKRVLMNVVYTNPNDRFFVKIDGKKCDIMNIVFQLDLATVKKSLPISKVTKYEAEDKMHSQLIKFGGVDMDGNKTIQFIKNQDESIGLSFGN